MRKNWLSFLGCLALSAGQSFVFAQDDEIAPAATEVTEKASEPAPAPTATESVVQQARDVLESTALGFRRVVADVGFENAQRTTVRVARNGRIVRTRRVGQGGVAQVPEVSPGSYTILASGPEGFAAYGIYLENGVNTMGSRVGLVPQRDANAVRGLIQAHLQDDSIGDTAAAPVDDVSSGYNSDFELDDNGAIRGRVVHTTPTDEQPQPIANMFVAFVRNGEVVSESRSDSNGVFTISGLDVGVYSFVVAGREGFATFSTAIVETESHVQARVRELHFVALRGSTSTSVTPASASDFPLFNQAISGSQNDGQSGPQSAMGTGGPGAGGMGGGAGGGAGGGGFGGGGLLGALAGGAIGALVADQLNDDDKPATNATP